jgi:hypothetical protein
MEMWGLPPVISEEEGCLYSHLGIKLYTSGGIFSKS